MADKIVPDENSVRLRSSPGIIAPGSPLHPSNATPCLSSRVRENTGRPSRVAFSRAAFLVLPFSFSFSFLIVDTAPRSTSRARWILYRASPISLQTLSSNLSSRKRLICNSAAASQCRESAADSRVTSTLDSLFHSGNDIQYTASSVIGGFSGNLFFARKSFCPLAVSRVGQYIGRREEIVVKRQGERGTKKKKERERETEGTDGRRKGNPFADVCYEVHPPAHSSSPR